MLILSLQGQNSKMIPRAKHEGYISVWARVRSTRVPNIIHHEGGGCKRYKNQRDRFELFSLAIVIIFEILSLQGQN